VASLNFANKAIISQTEYKMETKLQWKTNRKYLTTPLSDSEGVWAVISNVISKVKYFLKSQADKQSQTL